MPTAFLDHIGDVSDHRVPGMVTYPLDEILLSTLVGVLCGGDDWETIELLSQEYLPWLKQFLPYKHGIPQAQTFRKVFRLLKPGGHAIVNVAAMPVLRGDHSVLSRELRRYSRDELRARLEAAGFVIQRLTYTNATLFLPLAIARLLQRRRGLRRESEADAEIAVPPAPINALMTAVMRLEALWLRAFDEPFGSSLLCLARKPEASPS